MEYHLFLRQQSIAMRHGLGCLPSQSCAGDQVTPNPSHNRLYENCTVTISTLPKIIVLCGIATVNKCSVIYSVVLKSILASFLSAQKFD